MYPPSGIFSFPQKPNKWTTVCLYVDNSEWLKIQNCISWNPVITLTRLRPHCDSEKSSLQFYHSNDLFYPWTWFGIPVPGPCDRSSLPPCLLLSNFFLSVFLFHGMTVSSIIVICFLTFDCIHIPFLIWLFLLKYCFRCLSVFLAQQAPFKKKKSSLITLILNSHFTEYWVLW